MKRILSISFALVLALSLMAGCVPKTTNNNGANTPNTTDGANGGVVDGNAANDGVADKVTPGDADLDNDTIPDDRDGDGVNDLVDDVTPGNKAAVR